VLIFSPKYVYKEFLGIEWDSIALQGEVQGRPWEKYKKYRDAHVIMLFLKITL